MAAGKKRRVPEVLWRLFRDGARTMADTVVFVISSLPTAAKCNCKGSRCLGCSAHDAMSFLLRPDDPSDYRKLLTQCFVVVSHNAPPLVQPLCPERLWSQYQIVSRTIELITCNQSMSSNVICSGYDKYNHSSPIVELLTSSAWNLLLKRVGAVVMVYLLKYSSIFLPLARKMHQQVAGPPIIDLCPKIEKHVSEVQCRHPSVVRSVPWKRKRDYGIATEKLLLRSSFADGDTCDSFTCAGCNSRSHLSHVRSHCRKKRSHTSLYEAAECETGTATANNEEIIDLALQQGSDQIIAKLGKRFRPFRWQRRRKLRLLTFRDANIQKPCTKFFSIIDNLSERLQCCSDASLSPDHEKGLVDDFGEIGWQQLSFMV